jgi:hypothetical protein
VHVNIFDGEDDVSITGQFFSNSAPGLVGTGDAFFVEAGCSPLIQCISDNIHVEWSTAVDPSGGFPSIAFQFGSDPESLGFFPQDNAGQHVG